MKDFEKVYPQNPNTMLKAVSSLFPKFHNNVSYLSVFQTSAEIHQAMRISSESKFDLYFSLSLENVKISRSELDNSLLNMSEYEFRTYISMIKKRKLFDNYLKEVNLNLSRIPENRIELILSVLVFQSGRLSNTNAKLIYSNTTTISVNMISNLLFRISDINIRFDILKNAFLNSDFLGFQFLLYLLHIIELTHGRIAETEHSRESKLISLNNLLELETICLLRIKEFTKETNLFAWKEPRRVLMLWKFIEQETCAEYTKDSIKNNLNAIRFLVLYITTWKGGKGVCEYEITDNSYEKFISDKKAIQIITEARRTEEFWRLDENIINLSAAFIIVKEDLSTNRMINNNDIKKRVDEWRNEYLENRKEIINERT